MASNRLTLALAAFEAVKSQYGWIFRSDAPASDPAHNCFSQLRNNFELLFVYLNSPSEIERGAALSVLENLIERDKSEAIFELAFMFLVDMLASNIDSWSVASLANILLAKRKHKLLSPCYFDSLQHKLALVIVDKTETLASLHGN